MTAAITVRQLTKHYPGVQALTDLSLDVPQGSIYGFLGVNGAGKTTALKILAGLTRPTSGSATVAGVDLAAGDAYKTAIGYLGQEPRFYGWMSGPDVLRYVAGFYPWVRDPIERRVAELLDLVGLSAADDRPTRTYSGGMRQRLGIAQALIGRPEVLLLDEPASALDPIGRHDVLDLMVRLRENATIFYSTHILADVERISDHVAIIDKGRLVRAEETTALLASFTQDRIRVVVRGATGAAASDLAALTGVSAVRVAARSDDLATFHVDTLPGWIDGVQRAITGWAVTANVALVENAPERLDLEDVFLRLVDPKEHAA